MSMWRLVPVGKAMLMVTEETPFEEEKDAINEMVRQLIDLTGIPWIFIGNAKLEDENTVREIAERYYGIKR